MKGIHVRAVTATSQLLPMENIPILSETFSKCTKLHSGSLTKTAEQTSIEKNVNDTTRGFLDRLDILRALERAAKRMRQQAGKLFVEHVHHQPCDKIVKNGLKKDYGNMSPSGRNIPGQSLVLVQNKAGRHGYHGI